MIIARENFARFFRRSTRMENNDLKSILFDVAYICSENKTYRCHSRLRQFSGQPKYTPHTVGYIWRPPHCLTHWGWCKIFAIFQTIFAIAFSWMKMYEFRPRFHWRLLQRVQLTTFQHGLDNGLAQDRRQAIVWTNDGWFNDAYMSHSVSMIYSSWPDGFARIMVL